VGYPWKQDIQRESFTQQFSDTHFLAHWCEEITPLVEFSIALAEDKLANEAESFERKERQPMVTTTREERAFLVGIELYGADSDTWRAEESLEELALLAQTAEVEVVGQTYQRLAKPYAGTFLGKGKVKEIGRLKEELHYDLVIVDYDLTPSQATNLEDEWDVRVVDRTGLILDIFARHAQTAEGRLQVELAQYEYLLPRLRGRWTHLSRQAVGGVGLRGPGETQLEVDRRHIRDRIATLKRKLQDVHTHRELYRTRRRRAGIPIISLVGYTNAGKSTLLNALASAEVYVADQLFATVDPTTRRVTLPGGREVLFTDTVGFIQRLPTTLVAAFRATLEEIGDADVLVHVLDISHSNAQEQADTVRQVLKELEVDEIPQIMALNKVDLIGAGTGAEVDALAGELGIPNDHVAISALKRWGLDTLLQQIESVLDQANVSLDITIPYNRQDLVSLFRERGNITGEEYGEEGVRLSGRIPRRYVHRFEQL
jgi:GTP-binding protein HflX